MDLGIQGRTALLTASSRGLGKACALALAAEGVHVFLNGLSDDNLATAADEIRSQTGVQVVTVRGHGPFGRGADRSDRCVEGAVP